MTTTSNPRFMRIKIPEPLKLSVEHTCNNKEQSSPSHLCTQICCIQEVSNKNFQNLKYSATCTSIWSTIRISSTKMMFLGQVCIRVRVKETLIENTLTGPYFPTQHWFLKLEAFSWVRTAKIWWKSYATLAPLQNNGIIFPYLKPRP